MVVQHNLTAMNANRYLGINNSKLSKSLEKLASGYAINRAGDNAAGLAVSEKMRSQIAGMTQGVKNAQDGISMVQTFEGALTETHSILQRMKTLADQMANGSYDDAVDRAASQREFLQLNDELNQIADTDFNGVVVLNGGVMADGLKVDKNGQFNYKVGQAPTIEAATAEAVDLTSMKRDDADGVGMNVDDSAYGNKAANALWKALGLTSDANDLNVTFIKGTDANGNTEWSIGAAVASAGTPDTPAAEAVDEGITTPTVDAALTGAAVADEDAMLAWVKGEATANGITLKDGDSIQLTRTNAAAGANAWDIVINGAAINGAATYKNADVGGLTAPTGAVTGNISFKYNAAKDATEAVKGNAVNEDITEKAISNLHIEEVNAKDGASGDGGFKVSWEDADGTAHSVNVVSNSVDAKDGDYITVNFKPSALKAPTNLGVYENNGAGVNITQATGSTLTKDGVKIDVQIDNTVLNDGTMNKFYSDILDKLSASDIELTIVDHTDMAQNTITVANATDASAAYGGAAGDFSFEFDAANGELKIGYDNGDNTGSVFATVKIDVTGASDGDKIKFSLKPSAYNYTDADDLRARSVETTEAQKEFFDKNTKVESGSVSTSNAFKNSEAILTYKDNITLQVGARTKDAVNFTFTYDSDAIGDLKGDLDCTAKGLGTDKLTIATQEEANYAIDKIDQAINKVSLIRGNFGAIQNRLEHKIDNMNVSIENLTSAESAIRDTNMPQEMMNFTKQQILAQASQSMLAQANQLPQGVLSLLQ